MRGVDEPVGDREGDRRDGYPREMDAREVDAFDDDQEIGVDFEDGIAGALRGGMPVEGGIAILLRPMWLLQEGVHPNFISEVGANDIRLIEVASDDPPPVLNPFFRAEILVEPEPIRVEEATPHPAGRVVVDNDEDALACERVDGGVEDFERCFSDERGVGSDGSRIDRLRDAHHLVGEGETDRVETKRADGADDFVDGRRIESPDDVEGIARAVPVYRGEFDAVSFGIDDIAAVRRERDGRGEGVWGP